MKNLTKILTLFAFICIILPMKAQKYYDDQWKKVAKNYENGQYKSNLPLILDIQNRAMKEDNATQLIKSLKTEFSIVNQTQDDTKNDAATQFFKKLQTFDQKLNGEEKLVYQVLLGDFFKNYYDQHQWEINQRTNVLTQTLSKGEGFTRSNIENNDKSAISSLSFGEGRGEDIETWSKLDFKNFLGKHFAELSAQDLALQKIQISKYAEIFQGTKDVDYFPTFFDYKSMQYIDYLQNTNYFTKNELKENQPKILGIYDDLIAKNSGNSKLYFQHQKLNDDCAFTHCKNKQEQLLALYNSSTEGDYKVMIAQEIISNLQNKQKFEEALSWIEKVKKSYPKSLFLDNIKNQENQILQPSLNIKFENSTLANQSIHLVAEFKNTHQFSLNIYEVKDDYQGFLKYIYNSWEPSYYSNLKKNLVRKENFDLPKTSDYKTHKTSLEIKPLPSGIYVAEYLVEGKVQEKFYFIATNSRIIFEKKSNQKTFDNQLKLVNRDSGKILAKENLEFYEYVQQKNLEKYTGITDEKAVFTVPITKNKEYYRYFLVRNPKTNDCNLLQVYGNQYDTDYNQKHNVEEAQIFLDRAIYRPGQTVYFKVISTAFDADENVEKVTPKVNLNITLRDVNYEEIAKQTLTTNDFGSINGSFTLPQGKLNGQFSIEVDNDDNSQFDISGEKYFRVEEYKRPKFEVTFEPIKEEYKYGQIIELQGKAMMFSGVPLSNSTVNYEIKKQNIRWRYFWWYPRENSNENSILGEAKTNEKGEFTIKLDLKKDETLEGIQVDNYEINASVTDINGETQSAETSVTVSSVSHYIALSDVKENYFADEIIKAKVETKNYNSQNLNKSYNAKLSKLEEPKRVFRNNFDKEIQNLPVLSKEVFAQKFPHDYFDKSEKEFKPIQTISNKLEQNETLEMGKLSAGKYKLELYNIEGKDTIKTEKIFEVFDKTKLGESQKPFLKVLPAKAEYNRTEKAKFYIYSAIPNALVNVFVQNGDGKTQFEQLPIKNGILVYETALPKDESIENLNVQFQLVAFNDVQTVTENVKITTNKKPLKIELVTFRDKLQPNSKEKWTVKLSGEDKEKVTAEVLANMYDKSLDQFAPNSYSWQSLYDKPYWITDYTINEGLDQKYFSKRLKYYNYYGINRPSFDWFDGGIVYSSGGRVYELERTVGLSNQEGVKTQSIAVPEPAMAKLEGRAAGLSIEADSVKTKDIENGYANKNEDLDKIPVRQNLNETAFFYPNLMTDKDGNVSFEFTSPEALTQWKLMFLAHTKDARSAILEKTVVTQKDFSVTPNYPRFLREGDEMVFKSKLANLSSKNLNGTAQLQILDAFTNEDISAKFNLNDIQKSFNVNANGSTTVQWNVKVPNGVSSIIIKNVAKAGEFSDGEQKAIAVLPNRMLVTDAIPIFVKEGQTKTFVLENLKNNSSKTATNVSNTLELTTNPIWEVIFALPSLKNETNLSADVVFNKWFADVLASEIFKANPKMKTVFDEYQAKGLLNSNLEKNQELKQLLLEETPWVLDSKNETEQMQKLARLFDANNMRNSINDDWSELKKLQNPDGGFSWYAGYPSSYYNSLYILKNLGKLNEWLKGNVADYQSSEQAAMVANLVRFVDAELNHYFEVKKENVWSNFALDYLDTRHYWEKEYPLKGNGKTLKDLVIKKAKTAKITDFTFFGLHRAALLFDAYNLKDISKKLMTYLKETSVQSETQGVYWKKNLNDWGWYSSKTVNHAGALEAFNKLTNDVNFVEELKIWLVTQKEVSNWDTSRSTAEVIYTILNSGKSWTGTESDNIEFSWGGKSIPKSNMRISEVGENGDFKEKNIYVTGYQKITSNSDKIDKNLATVTITKPGAGIVQGGLFWQYYEDLDKIKSSETYISITKELYKKVKTVNGEELQKITENAPLKIGDKVTVRMILNSDRPMEFIHLKDMRAAGFEPVDVLSGYQWKNNLGYYQVTKDASTNFYIEYMPKGKFVFEYDYICNAAGTFSNGITTLQNYYAPQMNAHTQGTKVLIGE